MNDSKLSTVGAYLIIGAIVGCLVGAIYYYWVKDTDTALNTFGISFLMVIAGAGMLASGNPIQIPLEVASFFWNQNSEDILPVGLKRFIIVGGILFVLFFGPSLFSTTWSQILLDESTVAATEPATSAGAINSTNPEPFREYAEKDHGHLTNPEDLIALAIKDGCTATEFIRIKVGQEKIVDFACFLTTPPATP